MGCVMRPTPKKFVVTYGAIRLRIRVLATIHEVSECFRKDWTETEDEPPPPDMVICSFFVDGVYGPRRYTGTIYLAENSRLFELVPHEVYHAVRHYWTTRKLPEDEERIARAIGCLTAHILTRLDTGE